MIKITENNYTKNKYYNRIVSTVERLMEKPSYIAPVQIMMEMGLLHKKDCDDWRMGRIPYLEKVINTNLSKISLILRILRFHVHDLNMTPSKTVYHQFGKGRKRILRFTKYNDKKLEEIYSTHFIKKKAKKKVNQEIGNSGGFPE
jgi:hypothetical protein